MSRTNDTDESRTDPANGRRTVVAKRADEPPVDTEESRALATAAGREVVAELTQARPEDPGTHFGRGKLEELAALVDEADATAVVVDGRLTPDQHCSIREALPDGTTVSDRYRLVLELFESGASTKRARLEVERARLEYELPRIIESADEGIMNEGTEKGSPVYDVEDRIDAIERKLAALPSPGERFRERRREEGFDLVTIAGYTNAGKSTLLHRIADELRLADADGFEAAGLPAGGDAGADRDPASKKHATAAVADGLFETLETTTRRATIGGRPVLATDTVGFVDDLPHDLVASFSETLSEAAAADAVVLVADASDPAAAFREKLRVSLDVLGRQGVGRDRVVTACNKVDLLDDAERDERLAVAAEVAPDPIPVSVATGRNLDALLDAVARRLPTDRATLEMPTCDDAMAVVSRAYDRTDVESVDYDGDAVRVVCRGRPSVLERLVARAEAVAG